MNVKYIILQSTRSIRGWVFTPLFVACMGAAWERPTSDRQTFMPDFGTKSRQRVQTFASASDPCRASDVGSIVD
jgi:hypothetical protein